MSTSPLLRGLRILEVLGAGSTSLSEVARILDVDRSTVSRAANAMAADGWLVHHEGRWELGPRATVLGAGTDHRRFALRADELCHAVAGATGLSTMVVQLAGTAGFVVAHAFGLRRFMESPAVVDPLPLWAFAGGQCMLARFDDEAVDALVGPGPFPTFTPNTIATLDALHDRLAHVRAGHAVVEREEFAPGFGCVALPWATAATSVPTAVSVVGPAELVELKAATIESVLRRALVPGADLTTVSNLTRP